MQEAAVRLTGQAVNQVVEIGLKGVKLTFEALLSPIRELLRQRQQTGSMQKPGNELERGEQGIKSLNKHDRQLEKVDVPGEDVKAFRKELNRHGVDFAVMKDKATGTYSAYFKGQDVQRVLGALEKTVDKVAKDQAKNGPKTPMQDVIATAASKAVNAMPRAGKAKKKEQVV